jgi:hypothetical protein
MGKADPKKLRDKNVFIHILCVRSPRSSTQRLQSTPSFLRGAQRGGKAHLLFEGNLNT